MTTWAEVVSWCQVSEGPDVELDWCVWFMFNERPCPNGVTAYTGSMDAALALIAERLPGAMWSVCLMEDGPFAQIIRPMPGGGYSGGLTSSGATTPPLALVAAFALAMDAQP